MSTTNLRFPLNSESSKYSATIIFQPREIKTNNVLKKVTKLGKRLIRGAQSSGNAQTVTDRQDRQVNTSVTAEDYQSLNKSAVNQFYAISNNVSSESGGWNVAANRLPGVRMYLPQGLTIADAASYEGGNLGFGGAMASGFASGDGFMDNLSSSNPAAAEAIAFKALQTAAAAGAGGALLGGGKLVGALGLGALAGGEGLNNILETGTRMTSNPNTRAMFKSVPLREYSFAWKLVPESREEAEEIDKIIRLFREELYPESIELESGVGVSFKYPNVFDITILHTGAQVGTKILPSYLKSFQAVYNESNMGFHDDGKPVEVGISMTFVEATTMTKQKVQEGY